jgi:hypothetical protein
MRSGSSIDARRGRASTVDGAPRGRAVTRVTVTRVTVTRVTVTRVTVTRVDGAPRSRRTAARTPSTRHVRDWTHVQGDSRH